MLRDRMMNMLYVDLVGSKVTIFNYHPTPFCYLFTLKNN